MPKPKVVVKEIKKDIKVTEVKQEPSLESRIESEELPVQMNSSKSVTPTLAQTVAPSFARQDPVQVREELRKKDKEFSYLATAQATASTTRSYDPSIRSRDTSFFEAATRADRINPTIRASPIVEKQSISSSSRASLNASSEPSLRKFDEEKDYQSTRAEKYVAKRNTDD